jgi:hypothetical protein
MSENGHTPRGQTAAEKITETLGEMARPGEDAGEMELALASMALGVLHGLGAQIEQAQQDGELDTFLLTLARWVAGHRSDTDKMLLVVEIPRRQLPPGTRLHLLDEALEASQDASSPW